MEPQADGTRLDRSAEQADVREQLSRMIEERVAGLSLPSPFYTSPEFLSLDLDAIFSDQWIFVGTGAEIPEPGDYVTVTVGDYSVIVIRDDDEEITALHNVCRHRGARIINAERGSVGNIVCGYHNWTYAPDGALMFAPATEPDFDRSCFGLKKVAVRVVESLIFICLADDPSTDFDDVAPRIAEYIRPHELHRTKVAAQMDLVEEGNWKLVMENNRECYHCGGHPELSSAAFPIYGFDLENIPAYLQPVMDRYQVAREKLIAICERLDLPHEVIEELDTRVAGFRIERDALDGAGVSFSDTGEGLCTKLLGSLTEPALGRLSMHLQPNSWFHFLSDHAVTFSAIPISPGQTLVRTTWLVHEDAVEGVDYDVEALTSVWKATNLQDAAFVGRAQAGSRSPAYEPGPYLESEYQVEAFCHWYTQRLLEFVNR